jgi:glycosyltransferase involved in cell wall biosynthesis
MQRVSIIQREIPHYRVRFFEELYAQGQAHELNIIVYTAFPPAQPTNSQSFPYRVLPVKFFGKEKSSAYWMYELEASVSGSDIVIAPQELQCLTVPYLWTKRKLITKTWIWWGHGYNFQASVRPSAVTSAKEALKRFMTRRADGVITYTAGGADYWRRQGLPEEHVIPYYNTIDVEGLQKAGAGITHQELGELRRNLNLEGKQILLFSGRLYAEKRVEFLLRAFALLKSRCTAVGLLILGDGEERQRLEQLAAELGLQDVHFLGEIVNPAETAAFFLLADLMVIPGLVGLAIVHGFAFGVPLITTQHNFHSPEIEYLSDTTGVITKHDINSYAEGIAENIHSSAKLCAMKESSKLRGADLFLNDSVKRYLDGILAVHIPK